MHTKLPTLLSVAALLSVFSLPGDAALVGTSVTGSLTFSGDPSNYFDPGYGFVPASGYLNFSGVTVTVSATAVEFGYDDGASRISADFIDNKVTVSDLIELAGPTNGFQMTFTDSAFAGKGLIASSNLFPISQYSVSGDVITLDYKGGNPMQGQTLTATFSIVAVPEPSVAGFLLIAALVIFAIRYSTLYPYVVTSQQLYRIGLRCPSRQSISN